MPFNDTLLPALQEKIRQAIAPKSPRLAALLLDNNCAVLKAKFNNVDTQENLNSTFTSQITTPLSQNVNDANLNAYLQGLGFADAVNSPDNRTVVLAQMQAATIPLAMNTLIQQTNEYLATLASQKTSLAEALVKNERDAANPHADETAAIEAAKRLSRDKIAALDPLLANVTHFKEELERQNAAVNQALTGIRADNVTAANAPGILQGLPNAANLNQRLTQFKQGSEQAITEANAEIVKVTKRPEANLDAYASSIVAHKEAAFIQKHNADMKIGFDSLGDDLSVSQQLEILLLGISTKLSDGRKLDIRGLLAKHLWAKENNTTFAQAQREKDKDAVKQRITECKELLKRYEEQLAHLNNTNQADKVRAAKEELEKRIKVLKQYILSAEVYYQWLNDIIKNHNNQVQAKISKQSYTQVTKPVPFAYLQQHGEQVIQLLNHPHYAITVAGIGDPQNNSPLTIPGQLADDQMMIVKAAKADSVFGITRTGVHMLESSKRSWFGLRGKSQDQLEWDALQAMYAYVRDCQGEVPIPIYGNDERMVAALFAAAKAMGKDVNVLYGYTVPVQGSAEDQHLQQTIENMRAKLAQLGTSEAEQLETDPANVITRLAAPAA